MEARLSFTDQISQDLIPAQIRTTIVSSASEITCLADSQLTFTVFLSLLAREEEGRKTYYFKFTGSGYTTTAALTPVLFFPHSSFWFAFSPGSLCWTQRKDFPPGTLRYSLLTPKPMTD